MNHKWNINFLLHTFQQIFHLFLSLLYLSVISRLLSVLPDKIQSHFCPGSKYSNCTHRYLNIFQWLSFEVNYMVSQVSIWIYIKLFAVRSGFWLILLLDLKLKFGGFEDRLFVFAGKTFLFGVEIKIKKATSKFIVQKEFDWILTRELIRLFKCLGNQLFFVVKDFFSSLTKRFAITDISFNV